MDREALIRRIEHRLKVAGLSKNAASEKAGLNREYLRQLTGDTSRSAKSPKSDTIAKLAEALECLAPWLEHGVGSETADGEDELTRTESQFRSLSPENRRLIIQTIETLWRSEQPEKASK